MVEGSICETGILKNRIELIRTSFSYREYRGAVLACQEIVCITGVPTFTFESWHNFLKRLRI